ncbi:hypothetical protein RND71_031603 [Anisodus tanguticus]|uniref:Uncharacterized protein n=1 Tax=Anisodus tanguticus TaxID=243964 RepID=A0AAE1UXM6_9SOLA|nr:hypothetical protein RND71_031603 [Anisodus tanguticus]
MNRYNSIRKSITNLTIFPNLYNATFRTLSLRTTSPIYCNSLKFNDSKNYKCRNKPRDDQLDGMIGKQLWRMGVCWEKRAKTRETEVRGAKLFNLFYELWWFHGMTKQKIRNEKNSTLKEHTSQK